MGKALATSAVLLSLLAVMLGGYAVYKVDQLEHSQGALALVALAKGDKQNPENPEGNPEQTKDQQAKNASPEAGKPAEESPDRTETGTEPPLPGMNHSTGVKGKLAKGIGEVEVVSVKRIADPYTKKRNVVNVQLRFRRDKSSPRELAYDFRYIQMGKATLRDPDTSQVFKLWRGQDDAGHSETQYSDMINLEKIAPGSSADAYAWFTVPTTVKKLNVYIPNSSALENLNIE